MSNAAQLNTAASAATSKAVEITAYHKALYAAADGARKATVKALDAVKALLESKYGKTAPTYEQFRADRSALREIAKGKGLADDQWLRKPYNAAVTALYGALPEAQTAAAIAKRKVRDALAANGTTIAKVKAGAKKGETAPRRQSEIETLEQYIARIGVFKVLAQCALILEADESTKAVAQVLKGIKKAA